jgi:hypothetical protein
MKRCLDRAPNPKRSFLADCQARFPGLSKRGFERAWANAIRLAGAVGWGKAGRRRNHRIKLAGQRYVGFKPLPYHHKKSLH